MKDRLVSLKQTAALFVIVFPLYGVFFLIQKCSDERRDELYKNKGIEVKAEIERIWDRGKHPSFTYEYIVDGKKYEGSSSRLAELDCHTVRKPFECIGRECIIEYISDDPGESRFVRLLPEEE